jgi:hypothetical protein
MRKTLCNHDFQCSASCHQEQRVCGWYRWNAIIDHPHCFHGKPGGACFNYNARPKEDIG